MPAQPFYELLPINYFLQTFQKLKYLSCSTPRWKQNCFFPRSVWMCKLLFKCRLQQMAEGGQQESHPCLLFHFNNIFGPSYATHLENAATKTIWLVNALYYYNAICLLHFQFFNQSGCKSKYERFLRSFRTYYSVQLYVICTLVEQHEFPNVEDISKDDTG